MTSEMWLGFADNASRREVLMALRRIAPGSAVVFAQSAEEMRERFGDEEPRTVGAIIGQTGEGVSALNLAAAIARDGVASEVVLVARGASGSLRSRASRAGITRVIDATAAPRTASQQVASPQPVALQAGSLQATAPYPLQSKVPVGDLPQQEPIRQRSVLACDLPSIDEDAEIGAVRPVDGAPFETISSQLEAQASQRPIDAAPILTVASGRGGVGKTALIALMASVAGRWGMDVAVVDLDLSCGNLHSCFGVTKGPDLLRIAPDGKPTHESMGRSSVRCNDHVHLWGPVDRPETAELVMPHVATLLSYLSTHYDLVLVDTSTTFTDGVAQAVQACDRMLVVHDERPGAVASAARVSALAVRLGVARTRIVRVVNLADPRVRASAFEGRAEVGLETARMHRVVDGGVECEDLLAAGKVDEVCQTDAPAVSCVSTMLAQVLSELGRLPDGEEARKAYEQRGAKRRFTLFGKRKEVV